MLFIFTVCRISGMIKASPPFSFPGRRPLCFWGRRGRTFEGGFIPGGEGTAGQALFPGIPLASFFHQHSGDFWACAMAAQEVGLDLQQHTKGRREHISKRFFHPLENEYLKKNNYRDFFDVWAAKESYVKFTGSGIGEDFGGFSAASEDGLAKEINGIQLRSIPFSPDYSLCLCAKEIQNVSLYYENA